jgi:hypothetical protein
MYLVREVFQAKPGMAKSLVKMFKQAAVHFEKEQGITNLKVMTDITGNYWTVVVESETNDISGFIANLRSATMSEEVKEIMKGYMDCVASGHREMYLLE